jgi:adenylosuccinate synthase
MKSMAKADIVVDLQFGSTGKGLLCGYLAQTNAYDVVVNCNMPNAGHTYIDRTGDTMINKVLPTGHVSPRVEHILIGPGSVFDPEQLMKEIQHAEDIGYKIRDKVRIHPNAVILAEGHVKHEEEMFSNISSTMQGSCAAIMDKMCRATGNMPIAGLDDTAMSTAFVIRHDEYDNIVRNASQILVEGSQGYSLGIHTSFYPYVTSRSCTPAAFLDGCGVPLRHMRHIYGTARTLPIRVGNTTDGFSGPPYEDQIELEWDDVGVDPETTTVTGRERRIFSFSMMQMAEAMVACQPDAIFLNFANYLDKEELVELTASLIQVGQKLDLSSSIVKWVGVGPTYQDVKRLSDNRIVLS